MDFAPISKSEATESRRGECVISTDRARLDLDGAKGIPRDVVERIDRAFVVLRDLS
jgi:hypothetical protein